MPDQSVDLNLCMVHVMVKLLWHCYVAKCGPFVLEKYTIISVSDNLLRFFCFYDNNLTVTYV